MANDGKKCIPVQIGSMLMQLPPILATKSIKLLEKKRSSRLRQFPRKPVLILPGLLKPDIHFGIRRHAPHTIKRRSISDFRPSDTRPYSESQVVPFAVDRALTRVSYVSVDRSPSDYSDCLSMMGRVTEFGDELYDPWHGRHPDLKFIRSTIKRWGLDISPFPDEPLPESDDWSMARSMFEAKTLAPPIDDYIVDDYMAQMLTS